MKCIWHLCDNELTGKATKYCGAKCKAKYQVTQSRKNAKKRLVEDCGGACWSCGYNKFVGALQFHHPNNDKEFGLGDSGITRSYEKQLAEARKCMLLCANCHAEEHEGMRLRAASMRVEGALSVFN